MKALPMIMEDMRSVTLEIAQLKKEMTSSPPVAEEIAQPKTMRESSEPSSPHIPSTGLKSFQRDVTVENDHISGFSSLLEGSSNGVKELSVNVQLKAEQMISPIALPIQHQLGQFLKLEKRTSELFSLAAVDAFLQTEFGQKSKWSCLSMELLSRSRPPPKPPPQTPPISQPKLQNKIFLQRKIRKRGKTQICISSNRWQASERDCFSQGQQSRRQQPKVTGTIVGANSDRRLRSHGSHLVAATSRTQQLFDSQITKVEERSHFQGKKPSCSTNKDRNFQATAANRGRRTNDRLAVATVEGEGIVEQSRGGLLLLGKRSPTSIARRDRFRGRWY